MLTQLPSSKEKQKPGTDNFLGTLASPPSCSYKHTVLTQCKTTDFGISPGQEGTGLENGLASLEGLDLQGGNILAPHPTPALAMVCVFWPSDFFSLLPVSSSLPSSFRYFRETEALRPGWSCPNTSCLIRSLEVGCRLSIVLSGGPLYTDHPSILFS